MNRQYFNVETQSSTGGTGTTCSSGETAVCFPYTTPSEDASDFEILYINGVNEQLYKYTSSANTSTFITTVNSSGDATRFNDLKMDLDGDKNKLIACGDRGCVYWSNDGGSTWSNYRHSSNTSSSDAIVVARRDGVMLYSGNNGNCVMFSNDTGNTWSEIQGQFNGQPLCFYINEAKNKFWAGTDSSRIYSSTNGTTWTQELFSATKDFGSLIMIDDNIGFACSFLNDAENGTNNGIFYTNNNWSTITRVLSTSDNNSSFFPYLPATYISTFNIINSNNDLCVAFSDSENQNDFTAFITSGGTVYDIGFFNRYDTTSVPSSYYSSIYSVPYQKIQYLNEKIHMYFMNNNYVFITRNGGKSWTSIGSNINANVRSNNNNNKNNAGVIAYLV